MALPHGEDILTDFEIDIHTVTNEQFKAFVEETNYKTDAELYGWSFVLEGLTSQEVVDEVDGEKGYGRVQNSVIGWSERCKLSIPMEKTAI